MTVAQSIGDIAVMFYRIGALVLEKRSKGTEGSSHAKLIASPYPGDTAMGNWLGDVRAVARAGEDDLLEALHLAPIVRGGTDENTMRALSALPALVRQYETKWPACPRTTADDVATGVVRHGLGCSVVGYVPHTLAAVLDTLATRGHELLDEEEPWTQAPEEVDAPTLCPFCRHRSLRWQEGARRMRCMNAGCVDEAGEPHTWDEDDLVTLALETATGGAE